MRRQKNCIWNSHVGGIESTGTVCSYPVGIWQYLLRGIIFFPLIAFEGFLFFEIVFQLHFVFPYLLPNFSIYFSLLFFKCMNSVFIYCYCMLINLYISMYSRGIFVCPSVQTRDPANLLARTAMAPLNKEFSLSTCQSAECEEYSLRA